jgi:hypothetical protein
VYEGLSPTPDAVEEESHDWDAAMRQALQRESVDVLRHQLQVERGERGRLTRNELFVALGLVGFTFGVGYGVGALRPDFSVLGTKSKPKKPRSKKPRSKKRSRRKR